MEKYLHQFKLSRLLVLGIDFWLIYFSFWLSHRLYLGSAGFLKGHGYLFVVFCLSWWIVSGFSENIYRISRFRNYRRTLLDILVAFGFHVALVFVCLATVGQARVPLLYLGGLYAFALITISFGRLLLMVANKHYNSLDYGKSRKIVIVGAGQAGKDLHNSFRLNNAISHQFLGFFDDDQQSPPQELVKGGLTDLPDYCLREGVDEIYFALSMENKALIDKLARFADDNFIYFRIVPLGRNVPENANVYFLDTIPVITVRKEPLEIVVNKLIKRTFDIFFSLFVILTIFPFVVPVIALIIKLSSRGPVFFTQMRPGKKNQLFKCYKFRTMRLNNQTELQATKHDPRVTPIGRFLRKSNLDELPQFFNVLLGDMSVVGPRPNMVIQLEEYSKVIQQYKVRHFVSPGITGYAQVNGYRGETKQLHLMQKRVQYDVMYMENWSFLMDLKIIFLTVWNMVRGEKNAY